MQKKIIGTLIAWTATGLATATVADTRFHETSAISYNFEIARQPLTAALQDVSEQAGISVSLMLNGGDEQKKELMVGPLSGYYTIDAVLRELLGNHGFSSTRVNREAVAVTYNPDDRPSGATSPPLRLKRISDAESRNGSAADPESTTSPQRKLKTSESPRIEEVVVTAQKREERLQEVPISITVLGGDGLDRSTAEGMTELLNRVPGVATYVALQSGGTQLSVRGVTSGGALFNGSNPIAYYLDSVPFGLVKSALVPDSNAYDLARVEVLRGPQGTLYGASAQNGVVRVLTRDADLAKLDFSTRTSFSATERGGENFRGDAAINVPLITDKLAARAVVGYEDMGGWIDRPHRNDANDAQLRNMRLKLNAQPTDALSIALSGWISRADYSQPPSSDDDGNHSEAADEPIDADYDVYALKVDYDASFFSVSSSTSHLKYTNASSTYYGPFAIDEFFTTDLESEVMSQEVVVNSTGDAMWRWSFGGIYRDAEDRLYQTWAFFPAPIDFTDTSKSWALFGELTRVMFDGKLELTAGLRHFEDDVQQIENVRHTGNPDEPLYRRERSYDANSPRVVLTWLPTDQFTFYASYAEGFRSGFDQNANVPPDLFPPLDSDNLKNHELGAKGSFLDNRVLVEAAVFYIDWEDVQQTTTVNFQSIPVTALINGVSASGPGAEFGLTVRPIEGLELAVNASWNDLTMDSATFTRDGILLFEAGDRLNSSPEYTAGASLDYTVGLGSRGLKARFSASGNYVSEQGFWAIVGPSRIRGLGDEMLIARTSLAIESLQGWTATLFADNLNDERGAPFRLGELYPDVWDTRVRPRTIGVQLEYRFR